MGFNLAFKGLKSGTYGCLTTAAWYAVASRRGWRTNLTLNVGQLGIAQYENT